MALVATDVDGDAPSPTPSPAQGTKGIVTCARRGSSACTYAPNGNANGADSFTFSVSDGAGGTDTGVVTVTIGGVNDVPRGRRHRGHHRRGHGGHRSPWPALIPTATTSPSPRPASRPTAALTGSPPNLTYTPAGNYNGPDSFTFTANDGNGGVVAASVDITVDPVNDAPRRRRHRRLDARGPGAPASSWWPPTSTAPTRWPSRRRRPPTASSPALTDGACTYTPNSASLAPTC